MMANSENRGKKKNWEGGGRTGEFYPAMKYYGTYIFCVYL